MCIKDISVKVFSHIKQTFFSSAESFCIVNFTIKQNFPKLYKNDCLWI